MHEKHAFKVGLVLTLTAALFFGVVLFIPSTGLSGDQQTITVRYPHKLRLPMLESGSPVLMGGQRVGKVVEVRIEEMPASATSRMDVYVVVVASIRADLPLKSDCKLIPEGPPLGGPGTLILEAGDADTPLSAGAVIEGSDPAGFAAVLNTVNSMLGAELDSTDPNSLLGLIKTQLNPAERASLMAKLHTSLDDFNAVTASVRMQLDANQRDALMGRLSGVMRNLDEATRAIADQLNVERTDVLLAKVHTALDEFNRGLDQVNLILTESRQPLNATLTHVAHAAETIDMRIVEQFARETDLTDGASLLSKVHTGIDHLTKTLSDLSRVSDTARQIMVLNRDNINETLRNLKETSDHINYGIKFLIRRPWLLFNKPTAVETKQADILDAARSFLDAAGRLDDAASELRALADLHDGHIPDDDADLERIREALGQSFEAFKSAETALWEELDVK